MDRKAWRHLNLISLLMKCKIRSAHCTLQSVNKLNHPYESNGSLSFLPPSLTSNEVFFLSLPNKMQYTIRELHSTERKALNDLYASNGSLSFLPPHYHWPRSAHCTLRSVKELNHPYGSNGSLSFLPPSLTSNEVFFLCLPNKMQYTIRELYSTERKST